jgi:hypothetical protein
MVETKKCRDEIISFLKRDFNIDMVDCIDELEVSELAFQLKPDCDGTKIKCILHEHFGPSMRFHATEIGGILGILIED